MGISKKQFTLAAKAGLTREQAARFIGTAGQEPSPTEAYDKVGQLLKGRTPGQAMEQVEPTLKKPKPTTTATAGIKPIDPEVSQAQPTAQPKIEAATATEMIKPVEQPKKFEKRKISSLINEKDRQNINWKRFEEIDLGQQDPRNNTVFSLFDKGDNPFEQFGKGFNVNNKRDYINPNYNNVVLGVQKNAGVRTVLHEIGHLIDYYCAKKSGTGKTYLSEDAAFTNTINDIAQRYFMGDKIIEKKVADFFNENNALHKETRTYDYSKFVPNSKKTFEQYDKLSNEQMALMLKEFSGEITPKELTRLEEIKPITKQLFNEIDVIRKKYGFEAGEEMGGAMDDIVSALTKGSANKSNNRLKIQLKAGHSARYWTAKDSKGVEIFTHYLTMKSHPNTKYLDIFKKHWPELNVELERLYDQAYQIMGSK
jgi:hypothetical protein